MNTPVTGHNAQAFAVAGTAEPFPQWESIPHAVECPLCNYNLRGLTQPRCPECGYTFDWQEILDPTRRKHPYLFEHHPERNLWSFCKTLLGGLNPWGFWRRLHPAQPANLTRLTIYRWTMKAVAAVPLVVTGLWLVMMSMDWPVDDWPRRSMHYHIDPFAGQDVSLLSELIRPLLHTRLYIFVLIMTLFLLALPELSTAALLLYASSMRQAKIQKHHVDRCVAYSYDVVVWPIAGMLLLGGLILFFAIPITNWQPWLLSWTLLLTLPGTWLLMSIKLACAYRYYVRLRHAVLAVLAGQVIGALVMMAVILFLKEFTIAI
jgi:hypothetical protein